MLPKANSFRLALAAAGVALVLALGAVVRMRETNRRPTGVSPPAVPAAIAQAVAHPGADPEPSRRAPSAPPLDEAPSATEETKAPPKGGPPFRSSAEFEQFAMRLREATLLDKEPQVIVPTSTRLFGAASQYPWKRNIITTVFAIGEKLPGKKGGTRRTSAWNPRWQVEFGGADPLDPEQRDPDRPRAFTPGLNPFYCALPYNDVAGGATKPEARIVIPWFKQTFIQEGQSVCRDRWLAIRNPENGKFAYAQWSDCGPFGTEHWQYVFSNEVPQPNANRGAGLSISPAVRDHLGVGRMAVLDWRFVDFREVPKGPWALYGANNTFRQKGSAERLASPAPTATPGDKQEPR